MIPSPKHIIDANGRIWRQGQTAYSSNFSYTGEITRLYAPTVNQPARAILSNKSERYPRSVELSELEVVK